MQSYDVTLFTVNDGWVVKVGCEMFAFTDKVKLMERLVSYLDNPAKVIREFRPKDYELQKMAMDPSSQIGMAEAPARMGSGLESTLRRG